VAVGLALQVAGPARVRLRTRALTGTIRGFSRSVPPAGWRVGQIRVRCSLNCPSGCVTLNEPVVATSWNDEVEAALRAHLDKRGHPGPIGFGSRPLPQEAWARGGLSVQEIATRLSLRDDLVGLVPVRGSKVPQGPVLLFPATVWAPFGDVRKGWLALIGRSGRSGYGCHPSW
jgi:hypothetical protein